MSTTNGTGQGGKSFQDRELAARVRTLGLLEIEKVLKQKKTDDFKKQVILRLAGSLLPKLNEITGRDGKDLPTPILANAISTNNSNTEDNETQEAN